MQMICDSQRLVKYFIEKKIAEVQNLFTAISAIFSCLNFQLIYPNKYDG